MFIGKWVRSHNMRNLLTGLLFAGALAGCARNPPLEPNSGLVIVKQSTALPPPNRNDLTAPDRPALIGPLDTIQVDVFNVPELSREMQVDASGGVSMPLIGMIDARGKTAPELARNIETSLRGRYVRNPQVTINIKSSVSQVVTVDGQVVDPGLYPVTNQMTLMRAVASARGLTEFARVEEVVILRTVEGHRMAALYSIAAIRSGAYQDPPIYANDMIVVGDSPQRRLFRDVISLSPLIVAPLVAFLR
jgi:polysaccharide export outer membrane protein